MRNLSLLLLISTTALFSAACSLDASIISIEKILPGPRYSSSEFIAGSTLNQKTSGSQGAGRYVVLSSSGNWNTGNLVTKTNRGYAVYNGVIGQVIFEENHRK